MEGMSKVIASCGNLEVELRQSKEGVTMADIVETHGVDSRSRVKRIWSKRKRKLCKVRFSLINTNRVFQKNYMRRGVRKLLRTGLVPARAWRGQAAGAPTERFKLRRQMAAAAGKKESVSAFFILGGGAEGVWIGKWPAEQKEVWEKQIFEVQTWRQVRGLAEAVLCETRDLGIKWPQWHTSIFERASTSRHEVRLSRRCEEDASETGQVKAKHDYEDLKEGTISQKTYQPDVVISEQELKIDNRYRCNSRLG